jgi:hypothetical protein
MVAGTEGKGRGQCLKEQLESACELAVVGRPIPIPDPGNARSSVTLYSDDTPRVLIIHRN